nr:hypothetical protein [Tanacetum cinerariifolium]
MIYDLTYINAHIIDATPLSFVYPLSIVENVVGSNDPSFREDEQTLAGFASKKVPVRVSKLAGEASTSLDVDNDSDIHEFPSAKELKEATDCHWVDLDKNPLVSDMRAEIKALQGQVDGLHSKYIRLILEERKQEIDSLKQDRAVVFSKVISDAAMKLIRSDDLGVLIAKLVRSSIIYGHCQAFEEVAAMEEPFVLEKMSGYQSLSKKEYDQAGDALANASYPFLAEYVFNPYASLEQLLSKKPPSLRPTLFGYRSKPLSSKRADVSLGVISEGLMCGSSLPLERLCFLDDVNLGYFPHFFKDVQVFSSPLFVFFGIKLNSLCFHTYLYGDDDFRAIDQAKGSFSIAGLRCAFCSASLLVISNSNLNAYVYSFPSGLTTIRPAPESLELEAPLVNSFHALSGSGSFLLTSSFFASLFSVSGVSTRKSTTICPLIEFLPLNLISCSPNSTIHLAMRHDFWFRQNLFYGFVVEDLYRGSDDTPCKHPESIHAILMEAFRLFSATGHPLLLLVSASYILRRCKLCGESDFTITNVSVFVTTMGPSPIITSNGISPKGHDYSAKKPTRGVLEFTRKDLINGFSFKKQCVSYWIMIGD